MFLGLGSYYCAGILNYAGLQAMGKGMQLGPNGAVWGIMQSALIVPFLGGILLFGQVLTVPQMDSQCFRSTQHKRSQTRLG